MRRHTLVRTSVLLWLVVVFVFLPLLKDYVISIFGLTGKKSDATGTTLTKHWDRAPFDNNLDADNSVTSDAKGPVVSEKQTKNAKPINHTTYARSANEMFTCIVDVSGNFSGHCIRSVNINAISSTVDKRTKCVTLRFRSPTPICIYDPKIDVYVSGSLASRGMWEGDLVNIFNVVAGRYPNVHVLDLGCNLGIYTLSAAKTGKRVIAVDANKENLRLLSKSLALGGLTDNVTLIWNALSNRYTQVYLKPDNQKNIGGFFIDENGGGALNKIPTILLDDLADLFLDVPVAIKMDVEQSELKVIQGGLSFLKKVDVKFIQAEMMFTKNSDIGVQLVKLLNTAGFKAFRSCLGNSELDNSHIIRWPNDVCFITGQNRTHP